MTQRDALILEKREKIRERQLELKTELPKSYKTNLVLKFLNSSYNLNVCNTDDLKFLYGLLNSIKEGLEKSEFSVTKISGFTFEEWLSDLSLKIKYSERAAKMGKSFRKSFIRRS